MAPVLVERIVWKKPRAATTHAAARLNLDEQANVRVALRFLAVRAGGYRKLAASLGVAHKTMKMWCATKGRPGAMAALLAARLAGVTIEDVLSGAWPKTGSCPHCGRIG